MYKLADLSRRPCGFTAWEAEPLRKMPEGYKDIVAVG